MNPITMRLAMMLAALAACLAVGAANNATVAAPVPTVATMDVDFLWVLN